MLHVIITVIPVEYQKFFISFIATQSSFTYHYQEKIVIPDNNTLLCNSSEGMEKPHEAT